MDNEQGFLDDLGGWWGDLWAPDDNDPFGLSSRDEEVAEMAREAGVPDTVAARREIALGKLRDTSKAALATGGEFVGAAAGGITRGLFGVHPAVLLGGLLLVFLAFKKVTA